MDSVLRVIYLGIGLFVGLILHEYAHALVAVRLGDQTPRLHGRLTVNPKPHVDPFGSLVLPAILLLPVLFGRVLFPVFAYGKPTPLNPFGFRNQDRDAMLVAVAGPAANLVLALGLGGLYRVTAGTLAGDLFANAMIANVIMAVLNVVPLPPLDGARVIARFLPSRAREVFQSWEPYGALFILVIFFIFSGPIFAFVQVVGNGICRAVAGGDCIG